MRSPGERHKECCSPSLAVFLTGSSRIFKLLKLTVYYFLTAKIIFIFITLFLSISLPGVPVFTAGKTLRTVLTQIQMRQ